MNKENPDEYQIEDFLMDESFVNYHFHTDLNHQTFWEEWVLQHPAKKNLIKEAREMLQMLSLTSPGSEHQDELMRISTAIEKDQLLPARKGSELFRLLNWNKANKSYGRRKSVKYFAAAAGFIFLIGGYFIATVLGTVFNIKKQQGDSIVLVELFEGKLKIEIKNIQGSPVQPLILNPNERVVYNQNSKNLYKESWQRYNEPLLQKNHLVFRQTNFEEIAKQIKSVFGITLINQSNKKNWRFTGEFNNTTAKEIIENICLVKGLNSKTTEDTILIK